MRPWSWQNNLMNQKRKRVHVLPPNVAAVPRKRMPSTGTKHANSLYLCSFVIPSMLECLMKRMCLYITDATGLQQERAIRKKASCTRDLCFFIKQAFNNESVNATRSHKIHSKQQQHQQRASSGRFENQDRVTHVFQQYTSDRCTRS